jgi:MFS family permease
LPRIRRLLARVVDRGREGVRYLERQLPWYEPAPSQEGRNLRSLYAATTWFGLISGLAATFVPVFALRLGASTGQLGWLSALPALVNVVWLIPAARLIERRVRRVPLILSTALLQRLGYLAMAAMPFVLSKGRVEALIVLQALITLPTAVVSTAITTLIPDLTAPQRRGQVVSVRWLLLAITGTVAALAGGAFLDLLPVPLNYQILLGSGALLSLLSLRALRRVRAPDSVRLARASVPRRRYSWSQLRQSLGSVKAKPEFVSFSLASFVFYWGLYLPAALWSILRVRDLGATDTWIGIIAVVVDASTIVGYLYWGKVSARRGTRWLLVVTSLGVALYAALTALVPAIGWMIPTSMLGGLTWAGCNLALFNVMLRVSPSDRRATYVAIYTALMNVTAFAGPLLGAGLADWVGVRTTFLVAGGVRAVGALLLWRLVRDGEPGDH